MMLIFSLMNNSDIIRWSLDFRWQRADRSVGFYDLKQGVRLRSSTDPNLVIDWESFNKVDRANAAAEVTADKQSKEQFPETTWHSVKQVSTA